MSRYLLEICIDTAAGLHAAAASGADRIELCDALGVGGLTPSAGLMKLSADTGCPVRVMIRPRAGDFVYSDDDLTIMRHDIAITAEMGLAGVVFGANHEDGSLDLDRLDDLIRYARRLKLQTALHRSFDLAPDLSRALDHAISMGFDTVLTSGGAKSAPEGAAVLGDLVRQADGRIEILAGAGVTATQAPALLDTGLTALHASCRAPVAIRSPRAAEMGYAGPDLRDTDPALVEALRAALDRYEAQTQEAKLQEANTQEDPHVVC
ncbi:cutC family protein [Asticcacaulis biprosthecium C19]|uniref:PF03932 family protein CutC n=1 Tax=Asticcacaulis biprosthecium C19 TaxID=715226 RepID=F4QL90_9CAUL|nr:copper homeostasis protein CutC [Asticcacaulis biprosthecium]EGF93465.1 cutC family protein [Asticcacaulis biprosthecium C19]